MIPAAENNKAIGRMWPVDNGPRGASRRRGGPRLYVGYGRSSSVWVSERAGGLHRQMVGVYRSPRTIPEHGPGPYITLVFPFPAVFRFSSFCWFFAVFIFGFSFFVCIFCVYYFSFYFLFKNNF
jgi:hypothetical protein